MKTNSSLTTLSSLLAKALKLVTSKNSAKNKAKKAAPAEAAESAAPR